MINSFNEALYLEANNDVKIAVEEGKILSGIYHLENFGLQDIKEGKRKFHPELEPFSEEKYLNYFPDIEKAVQEGIFKSAFEHFCNTGYKEILENVRAWPEDRSEEKVFDENIIVKTQLGNILINDFDETLYLEANPDIKEAIKEGDIPSGIYHLENFGLKDIEEGRRRFHPLLEPYNENNYIEKFPEVKELVKNGEFSSIFNHFCNIGYSKIINDMNEKEQITEISSPEKVIVLLGIPRSGLTVTTSLLAGNCNASAWFLPYATRKNSGIKPFTNFHSIKNAYSEAFPSEENMKNTVFISETTADENTIHFMRESLCNLKKEGVEVHLIWLTRDIHHTYISQMETAFTYWGAEEPSYNTESYQTYIDFVKKGYFEILDIAENFNTIIYSYEKFLEDPLSSIYALYDYLEIKDYNQTNELQFEKTHIAGDPSFSPEFIFNDRVEIREKKWQAIKELDNNLDTLSKLFVEGMKERLDILIEGKSLFPFDDYKDILIKKYFDSEYYRIQYEDIRKNDLEPLKHYMSFGWKENRNPNADFETRWYRENFFDDGYTPSFLHYLLKGKFQINLGRSIATMKNLKIINPESYRITDDLILEVPKFKNPKVSIIIPAYNQETYSMACIQSIIENTENVSYEIIFMDDKSPDESARLIEQNLKNVKFISNGVNFGFLKNCNKGATFAIGEYILFLNNDTNVQQGWLSSLVELIESADDIGMVGSRLVYPTGQQQEAGGIIWNDASGWNFGRLDDPYKPDYNYVKEADYLTGAAMMIRTSLWKEIGGFDERYVPAYFEDSDLAFEVRAHGYRTMYQPKSVVIHFEGISHGTDVGTGIKQYQVHNREKFIEKWKNVLAEEQFPNGQEVFLARDRSRFKKQLLMIDHYLPHYDQDAGSRTVFAYLKMFVDEGFKVTFIGDNFYDYPDTPYLDALQQMGVEVLYGEWYANNWQNWLEENGHYFDYAFLNRPHISEKYIDSIKKNTSAKIIYYGHDLHFLREEREYILTGNSKKNESSKFWKEKEFDIMYKADISIFPSENEVKAIHKIDSGIDVQSMPAYLFTSFNQLREDISQTRDIMFVGGFNHGPNVDAVLWFIEKVWPKIKKDLPKIKFYIIGSNPPEEVLKLASKDVIVTGFISDEALESYYKKCRISVVPLRYGAGVKGKVVESLYQQIPIVTTTIGAEGLEHAENYMIIEDKAKKFAKAVINLYYDKKKLKELSNSGQNYCKQYFSYDAAKRALKDVFDFKKRK